MNDNFGIILGPILKDDIDILFKWINDRDLVLNSNRYEPVHELNHIEWFNSITKKSSTKIFSIRLLENNRLIGTCQLSNISFINRSAELQIRIGDKTMHGKGYGKKSLSLLLDYGFNDLNLNRIYLNVFKTNLIAIRLYESLGFKTEGVLRDADYIDGSYVDVLIMSLLKREYTK